MKKVLFLLLALLLLTTAVSLYAQQDPISLGISNMNQARTAADEAQLTQDAARIRQLSDSMGRITHGHTESLDHAQGQINDANDDLSNANTSFRAVDRRFIR